MEMKIPDLDLSFWQRFNPVDRSITKNPGFLYVTPHHFLK